jgi:hypothetical protein
MKDEKKADSKAEKRVATMDDEMVACLVASTGICSVGKRVVKRVDKKAATKAVEKGGWKVA